MENKQDFFFLKYFIYYLKMPYMYIAHYPLLPNPHTMPPFTALPHLLSFLTLLLLPSPVTSSYISHFNELVLPIFSLQCTATEALAA